MSSFRNTVNQLGDALREHDRLASEQPPIYRKPRPCFEDADTMLEIDRDYQNDAERFEEG